MVDYLSEKEELLKFFWKGEKMKEEKEYYEKRVELNDLLYKVACYNYQTVCSDINHKQGEWFNVMDVMVYFLTKPMLCEKQLLALNEVIDYMGLHFNSCLAQCYEDASIIIANGHDKMDDCFRNMNDVARKNLMGLVEKHLNEK